ncbi:uncharacterized protein PODANS_4_8270 [Podospora anserina S mat+]|uniref:Podospora anserina S mat+ genomic DNA chromosome 4, supercontig 4 n=1 Tax=Podospora anserina (strain S / ATCC MYA-4624 / DSM 980 / FGSC 10383) TaxID=515849 RepID=B2AR89_PODAN|nr:uncharacterized protein PODANS_4_8270 [Podospora anserina S mat+]CAP66667.1 unnamed protein product [Podospora anserina S mat+]CDP28403.1 Putative protein of unknown function [Podospora anserina S mat+]
MPRPQDPHLYGQPPPKKQKKSSPTDLSGSLAFTSQLTSLLASSSSTPSTSRPRPSKSKTEDLFKSVKIKRKNPPKDQDEKLTLKSPTTTTTSSSSELEDLARSRQRLESKSRLYAAMQRGDYIGKEYGLVDFDRKWAESNPGPPEVLSSSSSSEPEEEEEATIEYTDTYGRTRLLTPSQKAALDRAAASKIDLEKMAGRPVAVPSDLIFGDTIQARAFEETNQMEELARKRDRSATPPPETHYDANWEIRTKGVGFYKFSQDGETRQKEMEGLEEERKRTKREREGREREKLRRREEMERRRREIEGRRREMGVKKAEREASRFLEELGDVLGGGGGDDGSSNVTEKKKEAEKEGQV